MPINEAMTAVGNQARAAGLQRAREVNVGRLQRLKHALQEANVETHQLAKRMQEKPLTNSRSYCNSEVVERLSGKRLLSAHFIRSVAHALGIDSASIIGEATAFDEVGRPAQGKRKSRASGRKTKKVFRPQANAGVAMIPEVIPGGYQLPPVSIRLPRNIDVPLQLTIVKREDGRRVMVSGAILLTDEQVLELVGL